MVPHGLHTRLRTFTRLGKTNRLAIRPHLIDNLRPNEALPSELDAHIGGHVLHENREEAHARENAVLPQHKTPHLVLPAPVSIIGREQNLETENTKTSGESEKIYFLKNIKIRKL